ncbi:MAG: hypothetical protein ACI9YL_001909 [Luteibaculaceae bacterium]|jgi:uncharacterized protein (TIGR02231 family)
MIKKGVFVLIALTCSSLGYSQIKEVSNSNVKKVNVYQTGAQVIRTFAISAGGDFQLKGLSPQLVPGSIEFSGNAKFNVHNIQFFTVKQTNGQLPTAAKAVMDQLNRKKYDLLTRDQMSEVYAAEKEMLVSNKNIIGNGANVADLQELMGYTRTKLRELNLKLYEIQEEKISINAEIAQLQIQLKQLGVQESQNEGVMAFRIADLFGPAEVQVSYFVNGPRWQATYHLTDMENGALVLEKKAVITNNSLENWNGVKLTLNSGYPNLVSVLPTLESNVLRNEPQISNNMYGKAARSDMAYATMDVDMGISTNQDASGVFYSIDQTETINSFSSKEFTLDSRNITATLGYLAIPKLDPSVYIQATFLNTTLLEPGQIWVYRANKLVGKSRISDPVNGKYVVSLGKTNSVNVVRTELTDPDSKGGVLSGGKIRKNFRFDISSSGPVKLPLQIRDQVPVSDDNSIEVEPLNLSGGQLNGQTGEIIWDLSLTGGQQNIEFNYLVKHPKGYKLKIR